MFLEILKLDKLCAGLKQTIYLMILNAGSMSLLLAVKTALHIINGLQGTGVFHDLAFLHLKLGLLTMDIGDGKNGHMV